jgi:hypothetical protein
MKSATSIAAGLMFSFGIATHAQETSPNAKKSKIDMKDGGGVQTVTFTGCVRTGAGPHVYILERVAPVSRTTTTEATGTSGAVSTSAPTYALVPRENVELQTHVGRKAEVTGIVIPAADSKTGTKTKVKREGEPEAKVEEKSRADSDRPRLQVISVKPLQEPC